MWTETNTESELIQGVYKFGPDILGSCQTADDVSNYINRVLDEHLNYPIPVNKINTKKWFVPTNYGPDLINELYNQCTTDIQKERISKELELYIKHNMLDVLYVMKYIVDTLRTNNIVWGVGRGSSVASYVLFLIGVHKIDSIKYNLPIEEFFKGEQNG